MMTTKRWTPRNHAVSGLFVFVLLVVFALLCLTTVFLSVRSYMGVTQDVSAYAEERVLTGYLRGKVRAADTAGAVSLRQEDTGTVLCLRQEDWETRIFAYDGNLMEQLCDPAEEFDPELGERIADAAALDGAGEVRTYLRISLPCVQANIGLMLLVLLMYAFQLYKESYLLFGAYPCRNMYMIQHYISNHFNKLNFQNVAASAVSLTVLSLLLYMLAYPLAGRERGRA